MPCPCQIQKVHQIKSRSCNKYSHSINKQIVKHTRSSHIHIVKNNLFPKLFFSVGLISITRHCNTSHKIRHRILIQNVERSTTFLFKTPCCLLTSRCSFISYDWKNRANTVHRNSGSCWSCMFSFRFKTASFVWLTLLCIGKRWSQRDRELQKKVSIYLAIA